MEEKLTEIIRERYEQVLEKIANCSKSNPDRIRPARLVVVTKTHSMETISAAIDAGIREFGENYAEEAIEKIKNFSGFDNLIWHMIGHVQSRKASLVVNNFDLVHSLDSYKLALRFDNFAAEHNRKLKVLLECNVTGEETKFGFLTFDYSTWPKLAEEAMRISELPHLEIRGLMTMPPLYDEPEKNRSAFRKLRELSDYLNKNTPKINWKELSMGTSNDYSIAVEEGATLVRVGSAILGSRPKHPDNVILR